MNTSQNIVKLGLMILLYTLSSGAFAAGGVSLIYGTKSLDKNDWEPVESQNVMGIGFEYQEPGWPAAFVVNYITGDDSARATGYDPFLGYVSAKVTGGTTELGFGARSYLSSAGARFFVEGGLANITADIKVSVSGLGSASDSGSALGIWFGAGVDVMVGKKVSVGAFGRISKATVDISGVSVEAGGTQLNVFASYHFN